MRGDKGYKATLKRYKMHPQSVQIGHNMGKNCQSRAKPCYPNEEKALPLPRIQNSCIAYA